MSDERVQIPRKRNRDEDPKRVPLIGLILAGAAALLFVGGTLLSVLSAEDAEIEDEQPRPTLSALMQETDVVVRGVPTDITRLGQPRDAGVVATIAVGEAIVGADEVPEDLKIYDRDFRENWVEGEETLLFLRPEEGLPEGAEYRVTERCILDDEALPCPYDPEEARDLTDG